MCPNVGSYFALDAKYSHNYTSDTDVRSMFVVRLLVGEYTKGCQDYRRPPSKDGGDINFYDSCVDNVYNPSIYVVFDKPQIYPEYLLQYKEYNVGGYQASQSSNSYLVNPSTTAPSQQQSVSFSNTSASTTFNHVNMAQERSCIIC